MRIKKVLSVRRLLLVGVLVLILVITIWYVSNYVFSSPSSEPSIVFDFDRGSPVLVETQNTPFNQTVNSVTAYFASPSDPAFSVQSYETTFISLSEFSGKYLYANKPSNDVLIIRFSHQLTHITLTFATVEYRTAASNITLTAYLVSSDTVPIGSATAVGASQAGLYPQGTLSFNSDGQPFDIVRLEVPYQGGGATGFFVDNIVVAKTG